MMTHAKEIRQVVCPLFNTVVERLLAWGGRECYATNPGRRYSYELKRPFQALGSHTWANSGASSNSQVNTNPGGYYLKSSCRPGIPAQEKIHGIVIIAGRLSYATIDADDEVIFRRRAIVALSLGKVVPRWQQVNSTLMEISRRGGGHLTNIVGVIII